MAPWGAIVPLTQFGSAAWKKRTKHHLRAEAETRVIELTTLISSFKETDCSFVRQSLEEERAGAIYSLHALIHAGAVSKAAAARNRWTARWLLIAQPVNSAGFLFRMSFFVLLAMAANPIVRIALGINRRPASHALPAVLIVLVMAEASRRAAIWADNQLPRAPSAT
jgi:hypothetical protein